MYKIFKRVFDFTSALLLFIVIFPLLVIIAIITEINMGHPFYFTQERTTKGMKTFRLIKFRSMTNARDTNGELLPDEMRRTKFGNFLRSTSLDELPELINIIKGDMSVIGPRPLRPDCNPYYYESEKPRFNVRGGLIPPEVMHGYDPSWDDQLKWDAEYANSCSLKTDVRIFFMVFITLFRRNKEGFGSVTRESLIKERTEIKK